MARSHKEENLQYRESILKVTKSIEYIRKFNDSGYVIFLADEIRFGKQKLQYNSVDYIIGKFLTKNDRLINYKEHDFVNIYVIGTFKNEFVPIMKVANAFADFYLETNTMPNIIPIFKKDFFKDKRIVINKISNGVLIYDREGNLH